MHGEETIVLIPNEHFMSQPDGGVEERITDGAFKIVNMDKTEETYLN